MRPLALWRYEIRRAGWAPLLGPPLLAAAVAGFTLLGHAPGDGERSLMRNLFISLELALPLVAGIGGASLVGRDPVAELQLTMPVRYRSTLLRRLAVTVGWTAVVAALIAGVLVATGWWARWPEAHGPLTGQLVWLAPALWLAAFGFLAGAVLRTPAAAGGLVAVLWLLQQLFGDVVQEHRWSRSLYLFATTQGSAPAEWTDNRLTLVITAAGLGGAAWLLLGRTERLTGEVAE